MNAIVFRFLILSGAFGVAYQFQRDLYGGAGSITPATHPLMAYVALFGVALVVDLIDGLVLAPRRGLRARWRMLINVVLAIGGAVAILSLRWPDMPASQMMMFVVLAIVLWSVFAVLPRMLIRAHRKPVTYHLHVLWQNRALLRLWISYNVRSRYSQTILGILWIVLLPLATSLVLAMVFSEILGARVGNAPFVVFLLAGIVPWGLFSNGVMNSTRSVLGMLGLVNQIYFPREVLVLVTFGEVLIDLVLTFVAMLLVNALNGYYPNLAYVFIPALVLIQIIITLGMMLFVSTSSVLIRDVPPLVSVLIQLLFYLTPLIYPVNTIPAAYRWFTVLNPLSALIQGYREIVLYGRLPDLWTLAYPVVIGVVLLYTGYLFFKGNEARFADLL